MNDYAFEVAKKNKINEKLPKDFPTILEDAFRN